ncbi:hypothetical protein D5E86_26530, partial [Vibrio parahaemolyticus]
MHFYAAWAVILIAGLHAVAALKHHFIDKDNTLRKNVRSFKMKKSLFATGLAIAMALPLGAQAADYVIDTKGAHAS